MKRRAIVAVVVAVLLAVIVAGALSGSSEDDPSVSDSSCGELQDRVVDAYASVVEAYRGRPLKDFAAGGFFGPEVRDVARRSADIQSEAQQLGCDPWLFLARVIQQGDQLDADGPAAVAAKGMLLAQASNAVFFGPGSQSASPPPDLTRSREPENDVSIDDVQALDFRSLEDCADTSDAHAVIVQWMLNEFARAGSNQPDASVRKLVTESQRRLDAIEKELGCSSHELSTGLIAAMDGVEAVGFSANVEYAEIIKQAWLQVQDKLVDIDIDFQIQPEPEAAAVGDEVRIEYVVTNEGTVPLGDIQLTDLDVQPVADAIKLLNAGDTRVVSQTITLSEADVPSREIRVQLSASDPFGRVTSVGYQSVFVRVSE